MLKAVVYRFRPVTNKVSARKEARLQVLVLLSLLFVCGAAQADGDFRGRFLSEIDENNSATVVIFGKRGSQLSSAGQPFLEFAAGLIDTDDVHRGLVSFGPVWQRRSYLRHGLLLQEFSFAPTLLTSAKLDDRDLGGILHFTTGLGIGWKPSEQSPLYLGLRFQHISNGSIHRHNPGMDAVGLEFYWTPGM